MIQAFRRRVARPRPRVEALEPRALMAVAGSLDPGFGGGHGSATAPLKVPVLAETLADTLPYSEGYSANVQSVAALPDGGVVVSGPITSYSGPFDDVNTSTALSVVELDADGTPNASFGTKGQAQIPIANNQVFQTAVQANGQIIEASAATDAAGNPTYLAIRLNPNGTVDPTFGAGGVAQYPASVTTVAADRINHVAGVLLQSNGQIILTGSSGGLAGSTVGNFSAVRLNNDGTLDATYGTGGTATVAAPAGPGTDIVGTAATILSGDRVVLAGNLGTYAGNSLTNDAVVAVRLNTDGTLDATFGDTRGDGFASIGPPASTTVNESTSVAAQPTTGDLLIAGYAGNPKGSYFGTLYRLTPAGALDTTFGAGGLVHTQLDVPFGFNPPVGDNMAVEADGNIVLTDSIFYGGPPAPDVYKLVVLQLDPDGTPVAGFGNTVAPGLLQTNLTARVAETPAISTTTGDILLAGAGTVPSTTSLLTYGFAVDSILPDATTGPSALIAPRVPANFAGLGYSDAAVYDPTSGSFIYQSPLNMSPGSLSNDPSIFAFGPTGVGQAIPAAADYTGVGYDQFAAYLPASGVYAIYPSGTTTASGLFEAFGVPGAGQTIPAPADYYGTGRSDVAVYIVNQGAFAIQDPSGQTSGQFVPFGIAGAGQSIPVPADYYGSGQADLAVYLAASGVWAIQPVLGVPEGEVIPFGKAGLGESVPVPGDYDGSGKVELAVYVPSVGAFYYRSDKGAGDVMVPIGTANSGAIPVPGDYDGSGRTEVAIYSPSNGSIEYLPANGGPAVTIQIGTANDGSIPVATPSGSLPEFAPPPSPGPGAKAKAIVPSSVRSGATNAIRLSTASAVPGGPTLASARVALGRVNQSGTDPLKFAP